MAAQAASAIEVSVRAKGRPSHGRQKNEEQDSGPGGNDFSSHSQYGRQGIGCRRIAARGFKSIRLVEMSIFVPSAPAAKLQSIPMLI
jgi:hypothetical protein